MHRRVVEHGELLEGLDGAAEVLDLLVQGRLLTILRRPEPCVELAHEALITEWERLRRWREEEQALIRIAEEMRLADHFVDRTRPQPLGKLGKKGG